MKDKKFILNTGGTRGIGRAISLSQAKPGVTLFLNYMRDEESALSVKAEAEKKGAQAHLIAANLSEPDEIKHL